MFNTLFPNLRYESYSFLAGIWFSLLDRRGFDGQNNVTTNLGSRCAIERDEIVEAYHRKIAAHERATGEPYPRINASCVAPNGNIYSDSAWKPQLLATWEKLLSGKYHIELL